MSGITIITVVYNSAHTILDALRSVAAQHALDIEHIVVDGGSTDGTLEIIKGFASPPAVLISEPDRGIYDAMNKGIGLATKDIVGFLNSDDVYFDEGVLCRVQAAFDYDKTVQIVYGDLVYVRRDDLSHVVRTWNSRPYERLFFDRGDVPPHPSFFVKRGALIESGGFDLRYRMAADYELMLRLLKVERRSSMHLPETMVKMRLGGETNRSFTNIITGNKEIVDAWAKHSLKIPLKFWLKRYSLKLEQYILAISYRRNNRS